MILMITTALSVFHHVPVILFNNVTGLALFINNILLYTKLLISIIIDNIFSEGKC